MKYPEDFVDRIICGDCLEVMKEIPDESIDMWLTSPPYDKLRDYNGYNFDFENIAKELYRVLKVGGVGVWVVGDQTIKGSETGTSFRQALYFKDVCGFNLHDTMIYAKHNPVPYHHNRYNPQFEYMFIFSKWKPKTFNPIQENTKGYKTGKYRYPDGSLRTANTPTIKNTKMRNNIWYYVVGGSFNAHPAQFPEPLARDHIISWSNVGDIILDPMCGSGTTCKMAKISNRHFIGIDISEEYCEISNERIK